MLTRVPSPRSQALSTNSLNRHSIASAVAEYHQANNDNHHHNGNDKDSAAGSEDFVTGVEHEDDDEDDYMSDDDGMNPATMMFVPKMQLEVLDQSTPGKDDGNVDLSKKARCDVCFKYFSKHYMQSHMRSHTGAKPFVCTVPGCNRSFTQTSSRNAHVKKFHHNRRNHRDLHLSTNLDGKLEFEPVESPEKSSPKSVKPELQELAESLSAVAAQHQSESDEAFENDMPGSPGSDISSGGEKQCQYYNCEMTFTNEDEYQKHLQQHQVLLNSLLSHNSDLFVDGMGLNMPDSPEKYQDVKMESEDSDSEAHTSKVGRPVKTPPNGNSKHRCNICGKC